MLNPVFFFSLQCLFWYSPVESMDLKGIKEHEKWYVYFKHCIQKSTVRSLLTCLISYKCIYNGYLLQYCVFIHIMHTNEDTVFTHQIDEDSLLELIFYNLCFSLSDCFNDEELF